MLILSVALVFLLVGLLMYALCVNPKLAEIGRLLFFAGALGLVLTAPGVMASGGGPSLHFR